MQTGRAWVEMRLREASLGVLRGKRNRVPWNSCSMSQPNAQKGWNWSPYCWGSEGLRCLRCENNGEERMSSTVLRCYLRTSRHMGRPVCTYAAWHIVARDMMQPTAPASCVHLSVSARSTSLSPWKTCKGEPGAD